MKGKRLLSLCAFLFLACGAFAGEPREVRLTFGQKARSAQVIDGQDGKKGLFFYAQSRYVCLWLDQGARAALVQNGRKYIELFEKKRLKRLKERKFKRLANNIPIDLEWGSRKESLDRFAPANADFGYVFIGNSPYFSINAPNVKNQALDGGPALYESGNIQASFTKAQLISLIDAMSF